MRHLLALLALAVLLVGCGSDEQSEEGTAGMDDGAGVNVTGEPDTKPEVTVPGGDPPDNLRIVDLITGDGDAAEADSHVVTHYVGVGWNTGQQFDASWDRGQPIDFRLDQVIAGWGEGIPGMRVGGRRLLVIPADLAYGDTPPPGSGIEPGETLVFVVDLVGLR